MPTYTRETRLPVTEDVAYAYLSKASNLPTYFPRITKARQTDGDAVETTAVIDPPGEAEQTVRGTAWFHTDESSKKVTWGAEGPHDYHGELDFDSDGDQACTLTFTLHTESDHPGIDGSIDETLDTIRHRLTEPPAAKTDHPTGEAQAAENAERESPA
ncbi:hypothetical protein [Lapillicoccus sp.]|uniref:hypothetical protein n=1 Tax=Lapillicoccus sp. TaxID=1909287 RepID=UPI00326413F4